MITAESVLADVFGHAGFRAGQREAIEAVCAGRDALVLLPTGAGKSLCYQVPAVVRAMRGLGTTIVISPLIALMDDQVGALAGRGIAAASLHSHQDDEDQRKVIERLSRGELALLYASPERASAAGFRRLLARVRIAMIAIDEAHCVSQWGHDFRPEYMQLHELRELRELADVPVIALTATATPRVLAEIGKSLALRDPARVTGDFRRANLAFEVRQPGNDEARLATTIDVLERAQLRERGGATGRAIIYCSTRNKTESVAEGLAAAGFAVGHYHAGRTALARERAQRAFALGKTRVLVATSAFGMGVDSPDVRAIVHFQAPGSLEAYYQEAGRAGRDGLPGRCVMLFGNGDLMTQRKLGSGAKGGAAAQARLDDALAAIASYAGARVCRQQLLCAHFTGQPAPEVGTDDGAETRSSRLGADLAACGRCDACVEPEAISVRVAPPPPAALDSAAREIILAALTAHGKAIGKGTLAKALRGSNAKAIEVHGLHRLPQHGALTAASEAAIVATIELLVRERRLIRRGVKYPTVAIAGGSARPTRTRNGGRPRGGNPRISGVALELDSYRKRVARQLKWKSYMVFQRATIAAIAEQRPLTHEALSRITGLGPAKIARFGDDILAVVRRNS
jgi:ATP-dependent DNA helicase RecQ